MVGILLNWNGNDSEMAAELEPLAADWSLTVRPTPDGFLVQPEYMLGIHGLSVERFGSGWLFYREPEATTTEDFLLMHMTHRIAGKYGILLEYRSASRTRYVEAAPGEFESFEAYVDKVLSKEAGLVRDMKKNWMYAHRTRYTR